jgi:uridine kinase
VTPRRVSWRAAVDAVAALAAERAGQTLLVGVDGFGAAGKSSLAAAMAAAAPGAQVVHVDDFAGPNVAEWDWCRFRAQVLEPLLAGRPARYQVWNWRLDRGTDWVDVPPGRPVIVEGVSATRSEVAAPWDLTVWVDAPRDLRLRRVVERDGPDLLSRWLDDWMPSEHAYAEREHPEERVDLIVSGA